MKLLLKSVICAFVISCVISMTGFYGACSDIEKEVFRLHILANSDSKSDQQLKLKVRDGITEYTSALFRNCKNKAESVKTAEDNIENIKSFAQQIVYENGYNYNVDAYITNMSFNTRVYENFTLPAGNYDALRIVIGSGNGKNWWCMIYPALCIPSASTVKLSDAVNAPEHDIVTQSDKYEVKFKIVELFESLFSLFR